MQKRPINSTTASYRKPRSGEEQRHLQECKVCQDCETGKEHQDYVQKATTKTAQNSTKPEQVKPVASKTPVARKLRTRPPRLRQRRPRPPANRHQESINRHAGSRAPGCPSVSMAAWVRDSVRRFWQTKWADDRPARPVALRFSWDSRSRHGLSYAEELLPGNPRSPFPEQRHSRS